MPSIRESIQYAKKRYVCESCGKEIRAGDKYWRGFGSSDDRFRDPPPFTMIQCIACINLYLPKEKQHMEAR